MEPLIGLSLLAGGLWMMASQYLYAADRGIPIPGRGNGRDSLTNRSAHQGATCGSERAAIELKF